MTSAPRACGRRVGKAPRGVGGIKRAPSAPPSSLTRRGRGGDAPGEPEGPGPFNSFIFKTLFIYSRDTEREREAEPQAEGEAGSVRGARRGTRSGDPGSRPGPRAAAPPSPGVPALFLEGDTARVRRARGRDLQVLSDRPPAPRPERTD